MSDTFSAIHEESQRETPKSVDLSSPHVWITLDDIENIEDVAETPDYSNETGARGLRKKITSSFRDPASNINGNALQIDQILKESDEDIPDDVAARITNLLDNILHNANEISGMSGPYFNADSNCDPDHPKNILELLYSRQDGLEQMGEIARDQQTNLRKMANRIEELIGRIQHLEERCDGLKGVAKRAQSKAEAYSPLFAENTDQPENGT